MERYKVTCRIENEAWIKTIECREMTIKDGAYCFWTGEYGNTNRLIWSFPVMFTIIEAIEEEN
jgi:hypothetical protein